MAQTDDVFWIREVCDADQRAKLVTDEAKEWFATRTIADALISYEQKLEMAGERA
jgi:hypothetical protein